MRKTRSTKIGDLLEEIDRDPTEDLDAVATMLRAWADRLERHARKRRTGWKRPTRNVGGRPRAESLLDDTDSAFGPDLVDRFAKLVRAYRPAARRTRNPSVFRGRLPSGEVLLAGWLSGGPDFPDAFRARFAALTMEPGTPPRFAAARLVLWSLGEEDSTEAAERLFERFKKQGKTPAK